MRRLIERDARACAAIRANLRRLELEHCASVERANVLRADLAAGGPFGLVLADPPYDDDPWISLMERLAQPGVVAGGGMIVAEFSARRAAPDPPPTWDVWKTRRPRRWGFLPSIAGQGTSNLMTIECRYNRVRNPSGFPICGRFLLPHSTQLPTDTWT